jgi:cyclopropane fatty-acyl-phospholipid synthase-like methyltransferase/DUF1365 family protein
MRAPVGRLYDVDIRHIRVSPVRHALRHRSHMWLVDLDRLPQLPRGLGWLARFEARDHLGDATRSLRANVAAFLGEHGIDLRGGRITMLTTARSFGYVFNPLTLFWCHDPSGRVACVVAEVHNTYGQRHCYLLRPDDAGRADTEKTFYVSPFYPVDGHYRMSLPEPRDQLALTVTLHRPADRPFTASVRGVGRPAYAHTVVSAALRHPFATWLSRGLITVHGLRLWRKRLPVHARPEMPAPRSAAQRLADLVRDGLGIDLPARLRAWDGSEAGPDDDGPVVVLRSRRALRRLMWAPGELGVARAYVSGELDVDGDLAEGFRRVWQLACGAHPGPIDVSIRARARATLTGARLGALGMPPRPPTCEARLHGALHTKRRDRAAIAHHYDLSNDFYAMLLDETMAYSCAYFTDPAMSLADAQRAKLDLICRKLGLRPGMRLLDVGCGWGSLIVHAAENYGVHATGITLSRQQRDHVAKRIADHGLDHLVDVRLQDYRDLRLVNAAYDAVSSVEMGEHVGEGRYPVYAGVLCAALKPTGRLLLQQMSRHSSATPGGGPFIEAYIAPDMHMRPIARTLDHLRDVGFEIVAVEAMREHYVRTVQGWAATLESRWDEFVGLVGEQVARTWRLYLVGAALSFAEGRMGVDQVLAVRPGRNEAGPTPAIRSPERW